MSIFNRVVKEIEDNAILRKEGKYIAIPFPFKRFSRFFPGIQRGRSYLISANQKVGKTKITDFLFMYSPYEFVKSQKSDIQLKIFYFSLEMSKEDKIKEYLSYLLFKKYGVRKSPEEISSLFEDYILEDEIMQQIKSLGPEIKEFEETVVFIDNVRNPFGIYKHMEDYAEANGTFSYKMLPCRNEETGKYEEKKVIDYYIPNNPEEYVLCIIDNLNLLSTERGQDKKSSMEKWSSEYALKLRDRFKYIAVGIQQQAAAQESVENFKFGKLQPTADGLGDSKLTGRDCDVMFGLFAPNRYGLKTYDGFDISKLKDNYRELSII